ncbi:MAG: beta-lactamase family protein [Anaerolineae bacterium]|nr:beta-lactamase family protein [Anaerolineae bacterium]
MSQEKFEKVVQIVRNMMEEHHVPGVAVGLVHGDQTFTAGLGVTSVDNPLAVTDETLFQIGSISKTFTATAVMRLVEAGKLDLNAPVRHYLPGFRVADESVAATTTVRHLLTHSTGWDGDVFTDTGTNDDALATYVEKLAGVEQLAPPDTLFSYNNAAFSIAGLLIEKVTGKTYEAAIKELIFAPLGMERSFFFARDLLTFRFAVGHVVIDNAPRVQRPWELPRAVNPAGGITCHIRDLLRYARFYMGDGTTEDGTCLLTPESMQLLQTPTFPINDFDGDVGLSWWIKTLNGVKFIEHGGTTLGQNSRLVIAPARQFAIAILTNGDHGRMPIDEGVKLALREFLGVEEPAPTPIDVTPEQLQEYVGKYARPAMSFDVTLQDGSLFVSISQSVELETEEKPPAPPPIKLAMCGKDQAYLTEGIYKDIRAEFLRREDGRIGWLRLGARINKRIE